jgi:hypothetical protein
MNPSALSPELRAKIDAANAKTVDIIHQADPVLIDVRPAREVIPGMTDRMVLHSGPPVDWRHMCGAQRGSVLGAVLLEGWATTAEEATSLLERDAIRLEPNHHHGAVGPMAGATTASVPVFVVRNAPFGNIACSRSSLHQFGEYHEDALAGLRSWRDIFAPSIGAAVRHLGGVPLKPIISKALQMGDELHNRPIAASSVLSIILAPALAECGLPHDKLVATLKFLSTAEFLFLPVAMAAAKATLDAAQGIDHSTVVTCMTRNGYEFGIRVSGLGDQWFTAPSPRPDGAFVPGYSQEDAGLDMGDSAVTETVGWGAFVLAGALGLLPQLGAKLESAVAQSQRMRDITLSASPSFLIPALGFAGAPVGIDLRKVLDTGVTPLIDTAIAHKDPGHGYIGGGIVNAPMECFIKAFQGFVKKYW